MKKLFSLLLFLTGLSFGIPIPLVSVNSMAELKALPPGAYAEASLKSFYADSVGGGGKLRWVGTSVAALDSCSIYKPNGGGPYGRWAREDNDESLERCGGGRGVADNYPYLVAATKAYPRIHFLAVTYKYATTLKWNSDQNGLTWAGDDRGGTVLQYTGTGDGIHAGGNINQVHLSDFRLYSTTGNRALVVISDTLPYPLPDAGVWYLTRLDIRGWKSDALVFGLTVNLHTSHLEIVQNNGSGIVFPLNNGSYANVSTTWKDDHSWIHANLGNGVVMDGGLSATLDGTIYDSNGSDSTTRSDSINVIKYAGYTLYGGGATVGCVASDIGKSVTQGGVTIGTLATYDNSRATFIINCSAIPSASGAIAVASGMGAADSTIRRTHNSIGLYARRTIGLHVTGGHVENQVLGIYLDGATNSWIYPNYIVTEGNKAWGFYAGGACRVIDMGGFAVDVQAGGSGAVYIGALTQGVNSVFGNRSTGYTVSNQSTDALVVKQEDNNGMQWTYTSSSATPFNLNGSNAGGMIGYLNATGTSGTPHAGFTLQTNVSPGYVRPIYLDQVGDFVNQNPAQAKSFYLQSSGGDRVDQDLFWSNNAKIKAWGIGPTGDQMTGGNVGADFIIPRYNDTGVVKDTALFIKRSTGKITIKNKLAVSDSILGTTESLTTPLGVASGGTGAATLASNGVLYGNGTSAIQALPVNATGTTLYLAQTSSSTPAWTAAPGSFSGFANPTASIGKTTVNGSATTGMRSDGAPKLDTTLAWGWSNNHHFYDSVRVDSVVTLRAKILDTFLTAPGTPASGVAAIYIDAANKNLTVKNDAGTVSHTAQTTTSTGSQWFSAFAGDGSFTKSQPAFSDISGAALTAQITDANVTYAKIQNVANNKILGNQSGGAAAPSEQAITGSGSVMCAASPTTTGTLTAAAITGSGTFTVSNTGVNNIAGPLHIGTASSAARAFRIAGITLSGDNELGMLISPTFQSASTTSGTTADLTLVTAAAAFTMTTGITLHLETPSIGSGSAIIANTALKIEDQSGATTNNAIVTGKGFVKFGDVVSLNSATFSNAAYTFPTVASGTAGVQYAGQTGTMSASRIVNLPPVAGYARGSLIIVADESGSTSATNTLVITPNGTEKINGAASKTIGIVGGYDSIIIMSTGAAWVVLSSI